MFEMHRYKYCAFLVVAATCLSGVWGCVQSSDKIALDELWDASILVSPSSEVTLGYLEETVFEVTLADGYGTPLVGEPIDISFEGPAHNAHVTPLYSDADAVTPSNDFYTDETGTALVLFRAPDLAASFAIRFSSPAIEGASLSVDIVVDPDHLKLHFEVTYHGDRPLTYIRTELFEHITCSDLITSPSHPPVETAVAGSPPALFALTGLRHRYDYTVRVTGLNADGASRAQTCVEGLTPNTDVPDVVLSNIPFNLSGKYETRAKTAPREILAGTLDEMTAALDEATDIAPASFNIDPETAILDGIRKVVIEQNPMSEVPFDEVRNDNDLDGQLAQYFQNSNVAVSDALHSVWSTVKDILYEVWFFGVLEIGSMSDAAYPTENRIDRLMFSNALGDAFSYEVIEPESSPGTADPSPPDEDRIRLHAHRINLGLGDVLYHLVSNYALIQAYETADFAQALDMIVDCEAVADFLAIWLGDVATAETLRTGCEQATVDASAKLSFGAAALNAKFGSLEAEGFFYVADPNIGNQIETLVDGQVTLTWHGESLEGELTELDPISASFAGDLI